MTGQNFDSRQWAAHLAKQRQNEQRVTPILATQAKNRPRKGGKSGS